MYQHLAAAAPPAGGLRAERMTTQFVRSGSIQPFVRTLEELGAPVERCLSQANLPHSELLNSEGLVSLVSCYRFLDLVARREGAMELGLTVAERTSVFDLGRYGTLLSHSATVRDYIDRGIRFMGDLSNRGCVMWLSCEDDAVRIHQRLTGGEGLGPAIADAYTLVMTVKTLRQMLGAQWFPAEICLRRCTEAVLGGWLSDARGRVCTQQTHTSFTLPRAALCRRVADRIAGRSENDGAGPSPDMPDSFLAAVEYLVESLTGEGRISIDILAESMGISARQLQRRLTAEGCSYTEILGRARVCRAQQRLQDSQMTVAEIAAELGYTDASNFARAFRKVCGVSPAEYRRWQIP